MTLNFSLEFNATETNLTSKYGPHLGYRAMFLTWLSLVLIGNLFGGVASILIAVTTLTYKPLRSCSSSALMAHCAILDAIRSLVIYPVLSLFAFFAPYHKFPVSACRYIAAPAYAFVYANYWAYCSLAINRFFAAVFPHHYRYLTTTSAKVIVNILPWFLSGILLTFPFFEIGANFTFTEPWNACIVGPLHNYVSGAILALGTYFPCAVCGLCYVTLLIRARITRRRVVSPTGLQGSLAKVQRRYDMSRILFFCFLWTFSSLLLLMLAISWFPALIGNYVVQTWLRLPQFLSSAFNPVSTLKSCRNKL
jgi:7 transmembrane receptor (rhodopsin family)